MYLECSKSGLLGKVAMALKSNARSSPNMSSVEHQTGGSELKYLLTPACAFYLGPSRHWYQHGGFHVGCQNAAYARSGTTVEVVKPANRQVEIWISASWRTGNREHVRTCGRGREDDRMSLPAADTNETATAGGLAILVRVGGYLWLAGKGGKGEQRLVSISPNRGAIQGT